jgi:excinuclease UvrABC nuclease subunit
MSYRYNTRYQLPKRPAVYRLQERNLMGWRDIYVGQSTNVHQRWTGQGRFHHQHLHHWERHQQSMRLVVEPCWLCNLDYREARAIQRLNPRLNKLRPKPRWSPMVLAEDIWRALPWVGVVAILGLVAKNMGVFG